MIGFSLSHFGAKVSPTLKLIPEVSNSSVTGANPAASLDLACDFFGLRRSVEIISSMSYLIIVATERRRGRTSCRCDEDVNDVMSFVARFFFHVCQPRRFRTPLRIAYNWSRDTDLITATHHLIRRQMYFCISSSA